MKLKKEEFLAEKRAIEAQVERSNGQVTPGLHKRIIYHNAKQLARALEHRAKQGVVFDLGDIAGTDHVLSSSFSHLCGNMPSRYLTGNKVLHEIVTRTGTDPDKVVNLTHDFGRPDQDDPQGHKLALFPYPVKLVATKEGVTVERTLGNPQILKGSATYAHQPEGMKQIDLRSIEQALRTVFRDGKVADERIGHVMEILKGLSRNPDVVQASLEARRKIFSYVGIEHIKERAVSETLDTIINVLERLDNRYGKVFYEMPLSPRFDPAQNQELARDYVQVMEMLTREGILGAKRFKPTNHVKGIDSSGVRRAVVFDGERFAFIDEVLPDDAPRKNPKREIIIVMVDKKDIYGAMRKGVVIPHFISSLIAEIAAPARPHLGGGFMKSYGPEHLERTLEWLGMDPKDAWLYQLTTFGLESIGVKHNGTIMNSAFVSYITFGGENMCKAVTEGRYIEVPYGKIVA